MASGDRRLALFRCASRTDAACSSRGFREQLASRSVVFSQDYRANHRVSRSRAYLGVCQGLCAKALTTELTYAANNPMKTKQEKAELTTQSTLGGVSGSAPVDWPIEARISHRIMLYAAQRRPHAMNQFTIEDIVREELAKEPNDRTQPPRE
jgi:hypothetical protein